MARTLEFCLLAGLMCVVSAIDDTPFFPEKFEVNITYHLPEMGIEEPIYVVFDSHDNTGGTMFMEHYGGLMKTWINITARKNYEVAWFGDEIRCSVRYRPQLVTTQTSAHVPESRLLRRVHSG